MKKLLIFILLLVFTGCFSAPPLKRIKTDPVPIESEESKEDTRKAVDVIGELIKQEKAEDALPVVDALKVKYGEPTKKTEPDKEEAKDLANTILKAVAKYRKAFAEWQERTRKKEEYKVGEKSFATKAKESITMWLIILGVICFFFPSVGVVIWRFLRKKYLRAKEVVEEELARKEQDHFKVTEAAAHTFGRLDEFKEEHPEEWKILKPYIDARDDPDIEKTIKDVRKNGTKKIANQALEKK